jgi:hypothetical protein
MCVMNAWPEGRHRLTAWWVAGPVAVPLGLVVLAVACGKASGNGSVFVGDAGLGADHSPVQTSPDGNLSLTGDGGTAEGGPTTVYEPTGPVTDFPTPVFDGNAPTNAPTLFGPAGQGATSGGPCITEPSSDALFPQNWLRPIFEFTPTNGENLFELRLHVANQIDDLVVYTTNTSWTIPKAMWDLLRTDSPTEAMTLSIRGGAYDGTTLQNEASGSSEPMGIAPVQATGSIVYWTPTGTSALMGFSVGDESVVQVLVPSQVSEQTTTCIGCHASTPGGEYTAIGLLGSNGWPDGLALTEPDAGTIGATPPYLGAGGSAALALYNEGISAFSPAHWATGDRREIVGYDDQGSSTDILTWIDVEATSLATATGTIARNGDPSSAAAPAWSHDGSTIAYVSTNKFCDGRLGAGCDGQTYNGPSDPGSIADIYTVPYAAGAGGTATPLPGASSPSAQEYYPTFSPDDAWIAYDVAPNDLNMYNQSQAELYVIPAKGGAGTRLAANDPPACSGVSSPGVTNSWPKWGPTALQANGNTYYWLIFSSTRADGGSPQLYMTGIVVDGSGTPQTHGAVYLWNQPAAQHNHTPAWDTFKLPPVPVAQ